MKERRAIVVPSFGDRPWRAFVVRSVKTYADRIGADLHVLTDIQKWSDLSLNLNGKGGRKNKLAYALKQYLPGVFLRDYDRVALLDDTCLIANDCPDIFSTCSKSECGYTGTSRLHAQKSFEEIRTFIENHGLPSISCDHDKYMNSGVMVYGKSAMPAFDAREISLASPLLHAAYPHQTLSYYLLRKFGVPMKKIDKKFNSVMFLGKQPDLGMTELPEQVECAWIYHFTGAWKNRGRLIEQLAQQLEHAALSETSKPNGNGDVVRAI